MVGGKGQLIMPHSGEYSFPILLKRKKGPFKERKRSVRREAGGNHHHHSPLSSPSAFMLFLLLFSLTLLPFRLASRTEGKQQTHPGTALFTRYTRAPAQRDWVMKWCNNRVLEMSLQLRVQNGGRLRTKKTAFPFHSFLERF